MSNQEDIIARAAIWNMVRLAEKSGRTIIPTLDDDGWVVLSGPVTEAPEWPRCNWASVTIGWTGMFAEFLTQEPT